MFSFELSLFIVLATLTLLLILYIIYILEPPAKPSAEKQLSVGKKTAPKNSLSCPYAFGYLKKRDKNAPIPDECLSCPSMLECSASRE